MLTSPFCGECVHQTLLTKERKDPQTQAFTPICDNCSDAYIQKKVLDPFYASCEKLREKAANREAEYHALGSAFSKVYGDIKTNNLRVGFP